MVYEPKTSRKELTQAQVVQTWRLLETHFKDGRYSDGLTDEAIAEKIGCSLQSVKNLRNKNFGHLIPTRRVTNGNYKSPFRRNAARIDMLEDHVMAILNYLTEPRQGMSGERYNALMNDLRERAVAMRNKGSE